MLGWGHPRYLIWYGVAFRVSLRWVAGINSGEVVSGSTSEVTPEHGLYHDSLWDVTFEQSEETKSVDPLQGEVCLKVLGPEDL